MENVILVAEDSEDDEMLLKHVLQKAGLVNPILVVRDGKEAIAHLQEPEPSGEDRTRSLPRVLFLDLYMPRMDGFEVLNWIKGRLHLKGMLVVVLSHYGDTGAIKIAYGLGAHSFLTKPFKILDLYNLMDYFGGYWMYADALANARGMAEQQAEKLRDG